MIGFLHTPPVPGYPTGYPRLSLVRWAEFSAAHEEARPRLGAIQKARRVRLTTMWANLGVGAGRRVAMNALHFSPILRSRLLLLVKLGFTH